MALMRYSKNGLISRTREGRSFWYRPNRRTVPGLQYLGRSRTVAPPTNDTVMMGMIGAARTVKVKEENEVLQRELAKSKKENEDLLITSFWNSDKSAQARANMWKLIGELGTESKLREKAGEMTKKENRRDRMALIYCMNYIANVWGTYPELRPNGFTFGSIDDYRVTLMGMVDTADRKLDALRSAGYQLPLPSGTPGGWSGPLIGQSAAQPQPGRSQVTTSQHKVSEGRLAAEKTRDAEPLDPLKHLQADFEDYKKRTEKEMGEIEESSSERLVISLLSVLDGLELAVKHANDAGGRTELHEGIAMVKKKLHTALGSVGLQKIDAVGKPFDPYQHEAVAKVQVSSPGPGIVVEELRAGYSFRGHVIRPSMVKVGVGSKRQVDEEKAET